MYILGISAYYHDSAATLIKSGEIISATHEERFSRKKHDERFPRNAILFCLKYANITLDELDYIAFYDKPFIKFERLLETYLAEAPRGFVSFLKAIPIWLKDKLFLKETLAREFCSLYEELHPNASSKELKDFKKRLLSKLLFSEHHQSHSASAFYPSPFRESAILTIDGVGEWCTTSIAYGKDNHIDYLMEINFPHSLGLLYSAMTYYLGFKVNSGEYKVMGLAPYGKPQYVSLIKEHLIDIKEDGSFKLNMEYFGYTYSLFMTNERFHRLFDRPPRKPESHLSQFDMDLASSLQAVTEEIMLRLARTAKKLTNSPNLVLAGGVALNCVGNGKILRERLFQNLWIQPASNDAGGSLGSALSAYYEEFKQRREIDPTKLDSMKGSYLGACYTNDEVRSYLDSIGAVYEYIADEDELIAKVVDALTSEKVVGWHQGRAEFGPRALGARSILGDARSPKMQSIMNLKIKFRESFRPFAPSVLREKVAEWFELDTDSPYMLLVAPVRKELCYEMTDEQKSLFGIDKLNVVRSQIPAVTHIDYSARIQTVHKELNPRYHKLLSAFYQKTGCPVLINTSFNVRGEPIVNSPADSYRCFMRTNMDMLVIENCLLHKQNQPELKDDVDWMKEYELD